MALCGDETSYDDTKGHDGYTERPGWSYHGDTAIRTLSNDWAKWQAQKMHEYILRMPKYEG